MDIQGVYFAGGTGASADKENVVEYAFFETSDVVEIQRILRILVDEECFLIQSVESGIIINQELKKFFILSRTTYNKNVIRKYNEEVEARQKEAAVAKKSTKKTKAPSDATPVEAETSDASTTDSE